MISIIIPVYNAANYLRQCIESVLHQTYSNFELILINDGSTDESGSICDEYANKDLRIRAFHKTNAGVGCTRNFGIDNSKGEWITFVDADDWLETSYCEVLMNNIKQYDIIYFGSIDELDDGTIKKHIPHRIVADNRTKIEDAIFYLKKNDDNYEYFGFTWNKVFRSEIIKKNNIRFERNLTLREDEIFTAIYCRYIQSLKVLDCALYHYRVSNNGLTFKRKRIDEYLRFSELLAQSINYYSLRALKNYECNRVEIIIIRAIEESANIQEKRNITQLLLRYRKELDCTKWNTFIKVLPCNSLALFLIILRQYILKVKYKLLK